MKAGSKKNKSPLKDIQAASMAMEQEYKAVKRLKRLSIGNSLNFDPDLPLTDVDTDDEIIDFDLHNGSLDDRTCCSNSNGDGSGIGNHDDADDNKEADEEEDEDDDEYLDYGQYNNIDFLDIDPDSSLTDSDIWVPANAHPKLAPENFRKHVEQQVLEIQNKSKLQRSGSVKSSLGKERKLRDFSDSGITSQVVTKDITEDENEMSSSPDTDHYVDAVDGIQSHQGPGEWQRKPSLKELTEQLENLSQKAGLDRDDAVSLARTLSTKSIGITRVEKEVFAERAIDQIPRRGQNNLTKQDFQSRASLLLTDDFSPHKNNLIQNKLEQNPGYEQQYHQQHVYKDIQNIQKKPQSQQTADGSPLRASKSKPRGKIPDVPSRTSPTTKTNGHPIPHRTINQRVPSSPNQQQRSFDPRYQQKILYHNQQQQLYQQQQLQQYHHQNRQIPPGQQLNKQQQQQHQSQYRRNYPRSGHQFQQVPVSDGYKHYNKQQQHRQQPYSDQQTGKPIPLIKNQLDHRTARQQQYPQQYPTYGHVQQHKASQNQRLTKLQQNISPIQTNRHRQKQVSPMQTSPVTLQNNMELHSVGRNHLTNTEKLVQAPQSPIGSSSNEQLSAKELPFKEKEPIELQNATSTSTQEQIGLKNDGLSPDGIDNLKQTNSTPEVLEHQAPKNEKLLINKTRETKSDFVDKKAKDEKSKQKDRKTSFTSFFKFKSRSSSSASNGEEGVSQSSMAEPISAKKRSPEANKVGINKDVANNKQTTSPSASTSSNNFKSLFTKNKSKEKANEKEDEITGPSIAGFGLRKKSSVENLLRMKKKSELTSNPETGLKFAEQQVNSSGSNLSIDSKTRNKQSVIDTGITQNDSKQENNIVPKSNLGSLKSQQFQAYPQSPSANSAYSPSDDNKLGDKMNVGENESKEESLEYDKSDQNGTNKIESTIDKIDERAKVMQKNEDEMNSIVRKEVISHHTEEISKQNDNLEYEEVKLNEDTSIPVLSQFNENQVDEKDTSINEEKFNDSINEIIITNTTITSDMTEGNDTEDGTGMDAKQGAEPSGKEEEIDDEPSKASLRQALAETIRSQKITGPNQPLEMRDSAFGFPLPPVSQSTIFMIDHRLPVHVERAIYRLSHIKLADAKRPLRQQVLLSNFMYSYLNLINHTLWLQSQQEIDSAENETV